VARDKVLSDAMLEHMDKNGSAFGRCVRQAGRNIYRAKPERFKMGEEVKVSHILFMELTPESRAKAEQTLEELKKGADFGTLAKSALPIPAVPPRVEIWAILRRAAWCPSSNVAAFALQKAGEAERRGRNQVWLSHSAAWMTAAQNALAPLKKCAKI
jgi:peptidyl-prolyl cis-trans isomerase C